MSVLLALCQLMGGLAFFLYGMNVLSGGLGKLASGSLERSLKKATAHPLSGMLLGGGITFAIQSSSAMTVMLVGLVNSGLMDFSKTISVIMGSNIGTTGTTWILTLSGVGGEGWMALLKPINFSPIVAVIGVGLIMMSKKTRRQDIGKIMVGFAVLMYGMELMSGSMEGLQKSERFTALLLAFENPVVAVLISTIFTGIIQSSAATVGIVQTLAASGQISYGVAIPLVLGANIGTCATALLSSIGVSREAKKVSVVHIIIKILGTVVFMALFYGANAILHFDFFRASTNRVGVAMIHTVFNVLNTLILFPFTKQLVKLANFFVRPTKDSQSVFLDERLISTPSIAVNEALSLTGKMAQLARETLLSATGLYHAYDTKTADEVLKNEDELDLYEDKLGSFLVKLSSHSLSEHDSRQVSLMLHTIGDFERLGDHAVNLLRGAEEMHEKKAVFSEQAQEDLRTLYSALKEILGLTIDAFVNHDGAMASRVEPLEQVIDVLIAHAKNAHVERLQAGKCTIQMGFILSDLLTNFERVSDHCSNIAVAMIETSVGSFDTHEYLNAIKNDGGEFARVYAGYAEKYHIA